MYNVLFSFDPHQPGHKGEVEGEDVRMEGSSFSRTYLSNWTFLSVQCRLCHFLIKSAAHKPIS